jgi:hypothetical protein
MNCLPSRLGRPRRWFLRYLLALQLSAGSATPFLNLYPRLDAVTPIVRRCEWLVVAGWDAREILTLDGADHVLLEPNERSPRVSLSPN